MIRRPPGWWPAQTHGCFDDLVNYRLVGASACADRITLALTAVAEESEALGRDVGADVTFAGAAFCGLKPDTALYRNVARLLGHSAATGDLEAVRRAHDRLSAYRTAAQVRVVTVAAKALQDAEALLVHDYSSMVAQILTELGAHRPREVVVTAGEPLGQGPRVARLAAAAGHRVTYTPDMSVSRVIDDVDAFVIGVESFYADGSLVNTVGSLALALLCRHSGVPVIAPTELLKCDRDVTTVTGCSLSARLLKRWPTDPLPEASTIVDLVLDAVPSELVTKYATEDGLLAPTDVASHAEVVFAALTS